MSQSLGCESNTVAQTHFYPADAGHDSTTPSVMVHKRSSSAFAASPSFSAQTSMFELPDSPSPRPSAVYQSPISFSLLEALDDLPDGKKDESPGNDAAPAAVHAVEKQLQKFFESTELIAQRRHTMELYDEATLSNFDTLVRASGYTASEIENAMDIPQELMFNDFGEADVSFTDNGFRFTVGEQRRLSTSDVVGSALPGNDYAVVKETSLSHVGAAESIYHRRGPRRWSTPLDPEHIYDAGDVEAIGVPAPESMKF